MYLPTGVPGAAPGLVFPKLLGEPNGGVPESRSWSGSMNWPCVTQEPQGPLPVQISLPQAELPGAVWTPRFNHPPGKRNIA